MFPWWVEVGLILATATVPLLLLLIPTDILFLWRVVVGLVLAIVTVFVLWLIAAYYTSYEGVDEGLKLLVFVWVMGIAVYLGGVLAWRLPGWLLRMWRERVQNKGTEDF